MMCPTGGNGLVTASNVQEEELMWHSPFLKHCGDRVEECKTRDATSL